MSIKTLMIYPDKNINLNKKKINKNMIDWTAYIENNPQVLYGKLAIKNTRIAVDLILEKLAGTYSIIELLEAYPHITEFDIKSCLLNAADSVKNETVHAIAS